MLSKGGHTAAAGTYWNLENGERVNMDQEGVLPGNGQTRYIKASGIAVLAAGPVLGLIFAVFLPFIGIAMALNMAGKKLVEGLANAAAGSMSFGWRPVEAYLAGKKRNKAVRARKTGKGAKS
ncbi:MAG: hypothetical protein OEW15_03385 [Nitrospirota bacterium]|nr:hypothetical protein [Nitrospirota bacterium]